MLDKNLSRRQFLKAAGAVGLGGLTSCQSGRSREPTKPELTGAATCQLKVVQPSRLKILQFTDTHFTWDGAGGERDKWARMTSDAMRRMVGFTDPDLVVVTGDLWSDSPAEGRTEFMQRAIRECETLGVPWAFAWGNHDVVDDYGAAHRALTDANGSLYCGGAQEGNYAIEVIGPDGARIWDLIFLNTTDRGVQQDQRAWLRGFMAEREARGAPVKPTFLMFHIPLRQYDLIWEKGFASGVKMETVCYEDEDGSSAALFSSLGCVRACFCGHDHVNDYSGPYHGIELVYGRATGYGAYGRERLRKGGKLITVNCETGAYMWETVFPDGLRWRPTRGMQIESVIDEPWITEPAGLPEQAMLDPVASSRR